MANFKPTTRGKTRREGKEEEEENEKNEEKKGKFDMSVFNLFIISMAAYLPLSQCKDEPLFILTRPPPHPQPPFDSFPVKNPHNC